MTKALSPGTRIAIAFSAVALFVIGVSLTSRIPTVAMLGDRVRLPIFHGGSTWVNLGTFTLMGLFSLAYLATSREDLYRWAAGFLFISAPLWVVNTVLGVIAALRTWDFSATTESAFSLVRKDPRLVATFELLFILLLLLGVGLAVHARKWRAFLNVAYVAVMWTLLGWVFLDPGARALHPDNPVLNSGWEIKLPFFAIVGCLLAACVLVAWLWRDRLVRAD